MDTAHKLGGNDSATATRGSEKRLQVAIITGASSGIGRETAIALAQAGWSLVLFARRSAQLEETKEKCPDSDSCLLVEGDVTSENDVRKLFELTIERFGRLDLLFNNAGTASAPRPLEDTPLSDFNRVLNTNIVGPFLCTREALKIFKRQTPQGGRIINNGSIAAYSPRPHAGPYTTSKHALLGLTRQTALEGRSFAVSVTQIDIGNAHTQMAAPHSRGVLQGDGRVVPEATFDPRHVAEAVVHIAGLPTDVTVLEMNIMATGMPYIGRG